MPKLLLGKEVVSLAKPFELLIQVTSVSFPTSMPIVFLAIFLKLILKLAKKEEREREKETEAGLLVIEAQNGLTSKLAFRYII